MKKSDLVKIIKEAITTKQALNENLSPELIKKVGTFIKSIAKTYGYSEADAISGIKQALAKQPATVKEAAPSAGMTAKEKSAVVKKAKAGKDIGKKGPGFEKVEKAAEKKYGSKEAGQKVAAAAMWKAQAKNEGLSNMMYNVFKGKNSFKNRTKTTPEVVSKLAQISKEKGLNVDESGRWAWKEGSDKMDWNYDAKDGYLYYGDEYKNIVDKIK